MTNRWLSAQPASQFDFKRIEGLSQNTVYAIAKDKQGFMWIATADGLNRYDGVQMKVYKPGFEKKEGNMQGRIIRSELLEDDQEQIWFATDLTVHRFNKRNEKFTTYNLSDKKNSGIGIFANPLLLKETHLWLASANAGVFDLNTVTKEFARYPLTLKDEAGNYIQLMYNGAYDGKDKLWFASSKGLLCFDLVEKKWQRYFQDKALYSVSWCRDTIFVCEGKEMLWVKPGNFSPGAKDLQHGMIPFNEQGSEMPRDFIHRVYTDKKFNIWVGDEKGNVYCRSPGSGEFRWIGNINLGDKIITNYPVYCFYADASGILWTGAYMLGLLKTEVKRKEFTIYPNPGVNKVNENLFVNAIYEDEKGAVWLGSFQKGIMILDKKTGKTTSLKLPYTGPPLLYGNSVHIVQADSKGNLWTGISGYLFVKESGASSFIPIKIPSPSNALQNPQVWSFTEYKTGWLVGTTIGVYFLSKEDGRYIIKHLSWFGQTRIPALWKKNETEVWIAFESGGLAIVKDPENRGGQPKRLFVETNVKSFLPDERHQLLWIATSNGLIAYHLSSGQYKIFAEKDGLLNSYVFGVLPDTDKLWISTNNGLFRAQLFFKKDSVLPGANFTNFTSMDGLPDNQFNSLAFHKGHSGNFYFGTAKGLVWFKPETVVPDQQPAKLRMINVLVNESVPDSTTASEYITRLSLPYYKNNLFFRFRGIDYTNPSKVSYAYKMEGWDKDWIYSNQLNEVRYSNLPDGKYLFKVKAANASGIWDEEPYTVSVAIHPPFWKTWWFYTLSVLIVLLAIVVITRFFSQQKLKTKVSELEKQKEIDNERQRISREMHDDIGAGLTQITLMSESVKNKPISSDRKELDEIASTSRQLVSNMSEIIWSLNPENRTLEQLVVYLREQLYQQLEYSGAEYSIQLPENGKQVLLTNEQRRNILLITKEIVNNAIKHSHAKTILINAIFRNHEWACEIRDDGVGFDATKAYAGNGLKNIRYRVEELGGQMVIKSAPGTGSWFIYSFPLNTT